MTLVHHRPPVLDQVLPFPDFASRHEAWLGSNQDRTWTTLLATRPVDLPVTTALLGARALPGMLLGRGLPASPEGAMPEPGAMLRLPLLDALATAGLRPLLFDPPWAMVFGVAGRFWDLRDTSLQTAATRDDFLALRGAGLALVAISFETWWSNAGSALVTETRVRVDDARARDQFRHYWRLIGPGSSLIRRELLRSVMRRAEGWRGFRRRTGWELLQAQILGPKS